MFSNPVTQIGVSSCLLGDSVRYDGGHQLQSWVSEVAGAVAWVPFCPELALGLTVPRPPMHLQRALSGATQMVVTESGQAINPKAEWSSHLERWLEGLDGWILKSRSPSCGLNVEVRSPTGSVVAVEPGIFAREVLEGLLPTADESMLRDLGGRICFFESAALMAASRSCRDVQARTHFVREHQLQLDLRQRRLADDLLTLVDRPQLFVNKLRLGLTGQVCAEAPSWLQCEIEALGWTEGPLRLLDVRRWLRRVSKLEARFRALADPIPSIHWEEL